MLSAVPPVTPIEHLERNPLVSRVTARVAEPDSIGRWPEGCASLALGQQSVEVAIRERVRQYETAYNAGDADAVAAIHAVDGTHTYGAGSALRAGLLVQPGVGRAGGVAEAC